MTDKRDWNSVINRLTGWLVGLLAVAAFVLSYNALYHVALDNSIPGNLAYVWPLLVDFALVVFSLAVLRASLLGERTWWPWSLIILSTVMTVAFNLIHAPNNSTAQVVAGVAPVILFLSFETLMGMIKNGVVRSGLIVSIEQLKVALKEIEQQVTDRRAEIDATLAQHRTEAEAAIARLNTTRQNAQKRLDNLLAEIEQRQQELSRLEQLQVERVQASDEASERRQKLVSILVQEGDIGATAFAQRLSVARNTVYSDLSALEQASVIVKNGHGWEARQ